jgi:hypothetical protein
MPMRVGSRQEQDFRESLNDSTSAKGQRKGALALEELKQKNETTLATQGLANQGHLAAVDATVQGQKDVEGMQQAFKQPLMNEQVNAANIKNSLEKQFGARQGEAETSTLETKAKSAGLTYGLEKQFGPGKIAAELASAKAASENLTAETTYQKNQRNLAEIAKNSADVEAQQNADAVGMQKSADLRANLESQAGANPLMMSGGGATQYANTILGPEKNVLGKIADVFPVAGAIHRMGRAYSAKAAAMKKLKQFGTQDTGDTVAIP